MTIAQLIECIGKVCCNTGNIKMEHVVEVNVNDIMDMLTEVMIKMVMKYCIMELMEIKLKHLYLWANIL